MFMKQRTYDAGSAHSLLLLLSLYVIEILCFPSFLLLLTQLFSFRENEPLRSDYNNPEEIDGKKKLLYRRTRMCYQSVH